MPRTKHARKCGILVDEEEHSTGDTITQAPLKEHLARPNTIQNRTEDEEAPELVPTPLSAAKNTGMKLSIKLKQCPPPPPKPDAPPVENEPDMAQPTSDPTSSPASLADTVKVPRKKPVGKNPKKLKGGTAASSSRQAPATRSTAALTPATRDQLTQALLGDPSTEGTHLDSPTPKESTRLTALAPRLYIGTSSGPAPPTIPVVELSPAQESPRPTEHVSASLPQLAKMKESEVLYLGWTRVEELNVEVDKATSNWSNAAPTLSDVTVPILGEIQVEANEILMELQQRQVLEAKTIILAIFEGGKPDRELAMQWLDECFQEVGVAFRGRQVTFLGCNCYTIEVCTEMNCHTLITTQRITRPTYECFFYRYPPGFSPSQKETIHRLTMELDLIIDDLSETNNTPVFLAMIVEGFAQYLGKKATREELGGHLIHVLFTGKAPIPYKIRMLGKVYLVHIVESRTTPTTTPAPSAQVESRKCKRSPDPRTGTSKRPPGQDSVHHTGRAQGWRDSPNRSLGWGAAPSAQRSPSPTQPHLERSPEVNTQPHAKESVSRSSQRLLDACQHLTTKAVPGSVAWFTHRVHSPILPYGTESAPGPRPSCFPSGL
ncbi:hypothetical protein SELMODRAFT_402323 [Selaginella moellendorffii]|uniref:Uncharacterized protein n=1 Tax=Selaginella moellendorffii TaxID=88036 RepID=D8QQA0_SELML|nr:hypothetical protein SELMODRAFT_402323 [Selaginella moellendorffii]